MNKFLYLSLTGIVLILIEFVLLFGCLQVEHSIMHSHSILNCQLSLRESIELSAMRLIFYLPLWSVIVTVAVKKFRWGFHVMRLSVLNVLVYIFTSLVMSAIFPFALEFFTRSFFFYLIAATFLSPFILRLIPALWKMLEKVSGNG